jgi:hypothetical protein
MTFLFEDGAMFVLGFKPVAGVDGIRALRGLLKTSLRTFGLRCVRIHPKRS